MKCSILVLLVLAALMPVASYATMFGGDVLSGAGDFDDPGDRDLTSSGGMWSFFQSKGTGAFVTTQPLSPDYHFLAQETIERCDVRLNCNLEYFANRAYELTWSADKVGSSASAYQYRSSGKTTWTKYYPLWSYSGHSATFVQPGATGVWFSFQMYGDGGTGDALAIDDVVLKCEKSIPTVEADSSSGALAAGVETTVSLYNFGGDDGTYSINFDPDVQVSSSDASGISVVWVSDQQIDVTFTPTGTAANLMISNIYSDLSVAYSVPEPMTLVLLAAGALVVRRKR